MRETATFGGGCFWCTEAVFEQLQGVDTVVPGYAGGRAAKPSYEQVCGGTTGHAEVVQVTFDPAVISYRELLEFHFAFHDPTTLNAQGPDTGTQYRSIILTSSPEQETTARALIAEHAGVDTFGAPIVTEVKPLDVFWPAEAYHHHYYQRNPERGYCAATITPKMSKLRGKYAERLKSAMGQSA
jgi:peptide-methionine (S)-S-oxide reductase